MLTHLNVPHQLTDEISAFIGMFALAKKKCITGDMKHLKLQFSCLLIVLSLFTVCSFSIRTCANHLLLGLTKGDLSLDNNCKEFSSLN